MKVKAIGCDVGNNSVKLKTAKGDYRINTLIKKPAEARMIFGDGDKGQAINFLDVDIESEGISGNYYVGNLASGSGSLESIGGLKSDNTILRVAALTSIAYVIAMENQDMDEFELALGTGLPVREFFMKNAGKYDFINVRKYLNQFSGKHKVTFNTKLLNNRRIILNFDESKTSILPECYAGLLTEVTDSNGIVKEQFAKDHINVIGADLGGGSSDFSGFCNENYIEECMFGFDIGINEVQDKLCEDIKSRARLRNFTRTDLNNYIYNDELKGMLITNKGEFDLNKEKLEYYKPLADNIAYNFKKALNSNGFDVYMANYLFLFGGASEQIGDMIKEQLKEDIRNIQVIEKPMTRNVEAYYNSVKEYEG